MAMSASGLKIDVLQFDCLSTSQIFPILLAQEKEELKKPCLCSLKIKIFDNIGSKNVLWTIRKGKVTMQSKVGEQILCETTTKLQVFIWHSTPLHWSITF